MKKILQNVTIFHPHSNGFLICSCHETIKMVNVATPNVTYISYAMQYCMDDISGPMKLVYSCISIK